MTQHNYQPKQGQVLFFHQIASVLVHSILVLILKITRIQIRIVYSQAIIQKMMTYFLCPNLALSLHRQLTFLSLNIVCLIHCLHFRTGNATYLFSLKKKNNYLRILNKKYLNNYIYAKYSFNIKNK